MVPEGWRSLRLAELVTELVAGVSVKSEDRPVQNAEIGVLKTSAVTSGRFNAVEHKAVIQSDAARARTSVKGDSVIISRMNTSALVGASAYVEQDHPNLFLPDRLWQVALRAPDSTSARWLGYALGWQPVRERLSAMATGTSASMKNLAKAQALSLELLVPPFAEQRKIAEIVSSVDDTIRRTEAVIEQLNVLMNGLTEELVLRGLPARRAGFVETKLGLLPANWRVVRLEEIGDVRTGLAKNSKKKQHGSLVELPYLRVANVQDGYLDLSEIKTIEVNSSLVERYSLREGDVLFNEGGDADKVGRGTVWRGELPRCLHQNHVFAVRPSASIRSEFLSLFGGSRRGKSYFLEAAKQTTNLASINSRQLKALPVPLPPLDEQDEIVEIVGSVVSRIRAEQRSLVSMNVLKTALLDGLLAGCIRVPSHEEEAA